MTKAKLPDGRVEEITIVQQGGGTWLVRHSIDGQLTLNTKGGFITKKEAEEYAIGICLGEHK